MLKRKTVKSIYERTVAELNEVEQLNEQRKQVAEARVEAESQKLKAAEDEVSKAREAKKGFAKLFGMEAAE